MFELMEKERCFFYHCDRLRYGHKGVESHPSSARQWKTLSSSWSTHFFSFGYHKTWSKFQSFAIAGTGLQYRSRHNQHCPVATTIPPSSPCHIFTVHPYCHCASAHNPTLRLPFTTSSPWTVRAQYTQSLPCLTLMAATIANREHLQCHLPTQLVTHAIHDLLACANASSTCSHPQRKRRTQV